MAQSMGVPKPLIYVIAFAALFLFGGFVAVASLDPFEGRFIVGGVGAILLGALAAAIFKRFS